MTLAVKAHVQVGLANPFLICNECKGKVRYWHNPDRCGDECDESFFNYPCGHVTGVTSICPSWGPVDGCKCGDPETHS